MDVDGDPMRRFLFIFQHVMTSLTDKIDRIVDLCDPLLCDPRFLPWLASWVSFELDESANKQFDYMLTFRGPEGVAEFGLPVATFNLLG